ncbi:Paf1 RNA polymerase II complex component LEO1 [Babesia ovis]|uniref:Paf1 RNA polymerase II complex component LEO1 n=1 Tax=Babesia ovis TaxID=5869 RepID=A0A9W5T8H1_BABOV|nr:Paf1 RNA polymerase II complex component LEO1 [Babesia ovis]
MAEEEFERGLFEDSEGSSGEQELDSHLTTDDAPMNEDVAPAMPGPITEMDIDTTPLTATHKSILRTAFPVRDHHLVICKFPPAVAIAASPFNEAMERQMLAQNPKMLEEPVGSDNSVMMRWRFKPSPEGSSSPFGELETNTHFVEWDDGSFTLFVGSTPLNVDYRSETVFLLEDSCPDIKPIHAVITERMQTKFSNIFKNKFTRSRDFGARRQKMALTSIADAVSSHITVQRHRLMTRENERFRRMQQSSIYKPRGLTRSFLESDSDSQ